MDKETKMRWNDKSRYVKSDGRFRETEIIAFKTDGDTWHQGKIFQILHVPRTNSYEYQIDVGGFYFWMNRNNIKKIKKDELLSDDFLKFKIGDKVKVIGSSIYGYYFIKNANIRPSSCRPGYGSMEYVLNNPESSWNYDFTISENRLKLWHEPVRIVSLADPYGEEDWSEDEN